VRLIVPDASVILKWVLPPKDEPHAAAALRLRDAAINGKLRLIVPALWLYEVGNILVRKFPAQAAAILDALVAFGITEGSPGDKWRRRAVDLVIEHGVTFYDAAYHALALVEGGIFVTADERYVSRAGRSGGIILLNDFR
jgi:predicted nucleic acid-binding protein